MQRERSFRLGNQFVDFGLSMNDAKVPNNSDATPTPPENAIWAGYISFFEAKTTPLAVRADFSGNWGH